MSFFTDEMLISTIRLLVIVLLSGLIGIEREVKNHPAGLRTHIVVGVGSCMLTLVSLFGFEDYIRAHEDMRGFDPSRIPSYIISGIGFLGAGTILVQGGITVKGLTTAASIWVVAGLGIVVGIGMYYEAVLATIIIITTLFFLNRFEKLYKKKADTKEHLLMTITLSRGEGHIKKINAELSSQYIEISQYNIEEDKTDDKGMLRYTLTLSIKQKTNLSDLLEKLQGMSFITSTNINKRT
ncbi:MgtC/SapB family protein [Rossellomorea vietnamensis]|uniref:MgtC/SapB family protein n=1 Tax=Rossellomorea vietnamensis TaxID=218284 RepID=A0A5D4NK64_9BACI|nr:MgtC/SapB family protein [Rossellomorea vietnamensis]TYS13322.1 MgtC/SapB family protein [Rossellomorea vietnamensis]